MLLEHKPNTIILMSGLSTDGYIHESWRLCPCFFYFIHCMQSGSESFPLAFSVPSAYPLLPVVDIISHEVCSHTLSLGDSVAVVCLLNFTVSTLARETFTVEHLHLVRHLQ